MSEEKPVYGEKRGYETDLEPLMTKVKQAEEEQKATLCYELKAENAQLRARITELEKTLVDIEKLCDSLDRDALEGDKTVCHAGYIRGIIARVYPKHTRKAVQG